MELHSREFYPRVKAALDTPNLVVLGTVPVPRYEHRAPPGGPLAHKAQRVRFALLRYGHTVAEVEEVKARPDTVVIKACCF